MKHAEESWRSSLAKDAELAKDSKRAVEKSNEILKGFEKVLEEALHFSEELRRVKGLAKRKGRRRRSDFGSRL